MSKHFFLVFFLVALTIANGISAAEDNEKPPPTSSLSQTVAGNKTTVDNSTKSLIDSLGPSQDYPDYEIPKELAPDGVVVVDDYVPTSPIGGKENADSLAQPDDAVKNSQPSSAFRSSSSVLVGVAAVAGASLFFF
ncbi:hypothetical protein V5N11_018381 [Cardamine amara subsp. amara]|uniref:Transmembrane protein n=1 Tax=Cardamine amara subsp. amara TaxID=228776 RepID=A0ABD1BN53_CARAN